MNSPCPDDRSLEALLATSAPGDESERSSIEAHLDDCVRCQDRLLGLAGKTDFSSLADDAMPYAETPSLEFLESLKRQISLATTLDMAAISEDGDRFILDGPSHTLPELPGLEIVEMLGRGGMGTVYKAIQKGIDRVVAVKVIPLGTRPDETRNRARMGATLLGSFDHPNIVRLHHVGQVPGLLFGVLEFVDGGDLKKALREGPWPIGRAVVFMESLARVVGHLHARRVVHADIKPANILMAGPVNPKLADFGIAKTIRLDGEVVGVAVGGTLPYMAPEQFGERPTEVSPATDVHALGIILYELLTGRTPFDARPRSVIPDRIRTFKAQAPSTIRTGIPPEVDAIVLRCLEKEPDHRFRDADSMAESLRVLIESRRRNSPSSSFAPPGKP